MMSLPDSILPKREFFGLSIDRTCLRGIQIDRTGKMTVMTEIAFPEEVFHQNILVKGDIFLQSLTKLKTQGKFTTPYVVVCFPEAFAYTRELRLPVVPIAELTEAVSWHVKDLFPFPQEDLYVDWKIVRESNQEYILSVVAVPKKTIDPIVNAILTAELKPLRLNPDAATIARLLQLPQDKHAMVAEVNRSVAYVTLVEGEKAVFTTVIPYTKEDTAQTFLHNVNLTIEEITQYYKQKGVLTENAIDIVLTGEVASDQWLASFPKGTKILNTPPKNPAFNKAYAVAVSQVKGVKDEENINLLPPSMQKLYDTERLILYYRTILFRALSVVGAYCIFVVFILVIVFFQRQELDTAVKKLTIAVQTSQKSSQNLLRVNATAKQIVTLSPLRKNPHETLQKLLLLIPAGVTLSEWDYDDSKILYTIAGTAKTRDDLLELKANLEDSKLFDKISVPLSFLEAPQNISFSLSFVGK